MKYLRGILLWIVPNWRVRAGCNIMIQLYKNSIPPFEFHTQHSHKMRHCSCVYGLFLLKNVAKLHIIIDNIYFIIKSFRKKKNKHSYTIHIVSKNKTNRFKFR